jgi:hypothetical protein
MRLIRSSSDGADILLLASIAYLRMAFLVSIDPAALYRFGLERRSSLLRSVSHLIGLVLAHLPRQPPCQLELDDGWHEPPVALRKLVRHAPARV